MKKNLIIGVAAVLVAAGAFWYWQLPDRIAAESARLEGGTVGVSVSVPGTVREAYVKAGDTVAADQPLFTLDKADYEMLLARERIKLAEIASSIPGNVPLPSPTARTVAPGKPLSVLLTEEEEARRAVEVASHVYAAANVAFSRHNAARKQDAGERQRLLIKRDEAAISLKTAKATHEKASYARAQREAQDKSRLADNKPVSAALAARIADYQAQISRVRIAEQNLAATIITAPADGKVALMAASPGTHLAAGDVPVAIVPEATKDLWVTAFFSPRAASALRVNGECVVVFPGEEEGVKGFFSAIASPSGDEKRFAAHVVLDQNNGVSGSVIGQDVAVYVKTGRSFFLPGSKHQ